MFILKKGHQPGVYVPLRALFLVLLISPQKPMLTLEQFGRRDSNEHPQYIL